METFSSYFGQSGSTFFTDAPTISNFKAMIRYIITRVNTVTGTAYKDDSTILAWETGNELCGLDFSIVPYSWTKDIAAFIKSIDGNHLVMDGSYLYYGISSESLKDANIDICTNHYYNNYPPPSCKGTNCVQPNPSTWYSYTARITADAALASTNGKAFIAGEIGLSSVSDITAILAAVKTIPAVSGALVWSLRYHSRDGGFYTHLETYPFASYHLPGFPSTSSGAFPPDEKSVTSLVKSYATKFSNPLGNPYVNSAPSPKPKLIRNGDGGLTWMGSAGASSYQLEYRKSSTSSFSVVKSNLVDNVGSGATIYPGPLARGQYRMFARNTYGKSAYSVNLSV
jgi:hypothetical protein